MVVFDCCREDFAGAKERVIEAQKKTKFSDEIESLGKKETEIDDDENQDQVIETEEEERLSFFWRQSEENYVRRNIPMPDKSQNYCSVYGTLPGQLVDAKSNLAVEII